MNKYEKQYKKTETRFAKQDDIAFSLLSIKLKKMRIEPDIVNIIINYCGYSSIEKYYIKKELFDKVNIGFLYKMLMFIGSNAMFEKDYEKVGKLIDSFIEMGLIKKGQISEQNLIEFIMMDGSGVTVSPISFFNYKDISSLRGNCHVMSSILIREENFQDKELCIVLEPNALCGQSYHSFIVTDGIIFDFAHNIVVKYDNYVKFVKPTVLVKEKCSLVLSEIEDLKVFDCDFFSCEYEDVLKYGISKQLYKRKLRGFLNNE